MACVLTVAVIEDDARGHRARRRYAALQTARGRHPEADARPFARSANARTPANSPRPTRCSIRAATRCTATSAPNRTKSATPTSSMSSKPRWEPDAALLLCSDGLTDLVTSDDSAPDCSEHAGNPDKTAARAGEGGERRRRQGQHHRRLRGGSSGSRASARRSRGSRPRRALVPLAAALLAIAALALAWRWADYPMPEVDAPGLGPVRRRIVIIVSPAESIAAAIARADAWHH